MPPFGPIKRKDLIRYLRKLGFSGPTSRGKHQHMKKGDMTLTIPNPHKGDISKGLLAQNKGDISKGLLAQILREAGISREE